MKQGGIFQAAMQQMASVIAIIDRINTNERGQKNLTVPTFPGDTSHGSMALSNPRNTSWALHSIECAER